MATPRVLILSGYGLNCEEETKFAFEQAGASGTIIHVNDLIDSPEQLPHYQILALPGGFSFGDDTGSGNAFANKLRHHLGEQLQQFSAGQTLTIGICNGFQILANLGLIPNLNFEPRVALAANDSARYTDRWVDLAVSGGSPWLAGLSQLSLPIAHGEGKLVADPAVLSQLQDGQVALRYWPGEVCDYLDLPGNPNGSTDDIAGVTDPSGRVLGLMPHPERAIFFNQLPHWPALADVAKRQHQPIPQTGPGQQIFHNALRWFE